MKQLITRIYTYILFMMLTTTTAFAERMKFPAFIFFTLLGPPLFTILLLIGYGVQVAGYEKWGSLISLVVR